jgi:hypothetical protein
MEANAQQMKPGKAPSKMFSSMLKKREPRSHLPVIAVIPLRRCSNQIDNMIIKQSLENATIHTAPTSKS